MKTHELSLENISKAHSKVKSGADFPAYVIEIRNLGVTRYETFVRDGHTAYYGLKGYGERTPGKYDPMHIATETDREAFARGLKEHQQGNTDYHTFCRLCAATGVEKWIVDTEKMLCIYYDLSGQVMLAEDIPV